MLQELSCIIYDLEEILNIIKGEKKYCNNCGVELNDTNKALESICNDCKYGLEWELRKGGKSMNVNEVSELLKETIKILKEKGNKKEVDFFECLLEINENNKINGHEHVYAILDSIEAESAYKKCAVIKLFLK